MRLQGSERTPDERRAIAVFLSGKPLASMAAPNTAPRCASAPSALSAAPRSAWNGWSPTPANDRFQPQPGGLSAADVPKLQVKWAFGFAGDTSAAVQPTVVDGRVFVGSAAGRVYALSLTRGLRVLDVRRRYPSADGIAVMREGAAGPSVSSRT